MFRQLRTTESASVEAAALVPTAHAVVTKKMNIERKEDDDVQYMNGHPY